MTVFVIVTLLIVCTLVLVNQMSFVLGDTVCMIPLLGRASICHTEPLGGLPVSIPRQDIPDWNNATDGGRCSALVPNLAGRTFLVRHIAALLQDPGNQTIPNRTALAVNLANALNRLDVAEVDFSQHRQRLLTHERGIAYKLFWHMNARPAGQALWEAHREEHLQRWAGVGSYLEFWWKVNVKEQPLNRLKEQAEDMRDMLQEKH